MAKKAEATLVVKVLTQGKEALTSLGDKFEDMKDKVVSAAKVAGAAIAAIGATIITLAVQAGKFDDVKSAFERLAASQGQQADKILAKMKELTEGMVSEMDLMVAANKAALLGLPLDKFPQMLKIAKSASEATGESMQFMLDSIVTGLGRQSKLILDNLGIMINVEKAYDAYAVTLGKTAAQLTEAEKKQAFINEAMRVGMENAENMTGSTDNANKSWQKLKALWADTAVVIGRELMPFANALIGALEDFLHITKRIFASGFLTFALNEATKAAAVAIRWVKNVMIAYEELYNQAKLIGNKLFGSDKEYAETKKRLKELSDERVQLFESTAKVIEKLDAETTERMRDKYIHEEKAKQDELKAIHEKALQRQAEAEIEEAKATATAEKKILEKQVKEEEKIQEKALDKKKEELGETAIEAAAIAAGPMGAMAAEIMGSMGDIVSSFVTGGFEGLVKEALVMVTEIFLPGFGQAVGQLFTLLAQDSDAFIESINSMFSDKFLDNLARNIPIFIETLAERLPEFVEKFIEAIIENAPAIAIAWAKAFADPKFYNRMVTAVANGFANGIRDGFDEAWEYIKGRMKIKVETPGSGGDNSEVGKVVKGGKKVLKKLGFAQGGIVPGIQKFAGGGDVDTVPAMLTPGEFVVNRDAARGNMGLLKAINSGSEGSSGNVININVNGGLLGDERQAREFARAIDSELLKLRRDNGSVAFDKSIY